jgi:hypothetical protein
MGPQPKKVRTDDDGHEGEEAPGPQNWPEDRLDAVRKLQEKLEEVGGTYSVYCGRFLWGDGVDA